MISGFSRAPWTSPSSRNPELRHRPLRRGPRGGLRGDLELPDREVRDRLAELR